MWHVRLNLSIGNTWLIPLSLDPFLRQCKTHLAFWRNVCLLKPQYFQAMGGILRASRQDYQWSLFASVHENRQLISALKNRKLMVQMSMGSCLFYFYVFVKMLQSVTAVLPSTYVNGNFLNFLITSSKSSCTPFFNKTWADFDLYRPLCKM